MALAHLHFSGSGEFIIFRIMVRTALDKFTILRPLRHDYLIKYAHFDKMLFRTENWTTNIM